MILYIKTQNKPIIKYDIVTFVLLLILNCLQW